MKAKIIILLVLLTSLLVGCDLVPNKIKSITINGADLIEIGEEENLNISFNIKDSNPQLIFSSSDEDILTINEEGIYVGVNPGTATIRVSLKNDQSIYAELEVTVVEVGMGKKYEKSKILLIDKSKNYLELLNVPATIVNSKTRYLKYDGTNVVNATFNDLYVGMENIYVEYLPNSEVISAILIDGHAGYKNIRVGIRKSIADISVDSTRYHDDVSLKVDDAIIKIYDNSKSVEVSGNSNLTIRVKNGKLTVTDAHDITLLESAKRIIIAPKNPSEAIKINNLSRGSNTTYSGNLEMSIHLGKILVVNDINLEDYLYKVVPSEMPASYSPEALKAQAIAARTYAYRDILNRTYESFGYTVDDSVQSQVYNNINAQTNTTNAVDATKGLIMMHNGQLVNAFYYSTSSGLTGSAHEIWIADDNVNPDITPYLIGQNLTKDEEGNIIEFDYTSEENMLNFFKRIKVSTPDSSISYHRWKVSFTKSQLTATISKNLTLRYAQTPNLILTKVGADFVSKPISTDIGEVTRVYVGQRGTSGVVMSLIIETTTNTYKIINQYNIRFTLRPQDAGTTNQTATANSSKYSATNSNSIMFSGFFAIEEDEDTFTFYGGGNGHGVGMSQNGANTLGASGMAYQDILKTYYSMIDLVDITYEYKELSNISSYFSFK